MVPKKARVSGSKRRWKTKNFVVELLIKKSNWPCSIPVLKLLAGDEICTLHLILHVSPDFRHLLCSYLVNFRTFVCEWYDNLSDTWCPVASTSEIFPVSVVQSRTAPSDRTLLPGKFVLKKKKKSSPYV